MEWLMVFIFLKYEEHQPFHLLKTFSQYQLFRKQNPLFFINAYNGHLIIKWQSICPRTPRAAPKRVWNATADKKIWMN